ncbi:uncharacterized protein LOC143919805 isoform X2 [Arctopsyche grandis]|uniref:uncharacterized protein LOC143919805 isoform X2 n=1 Tax=Arctopsyche grandis TaxID=121162 RepID=UPI00406D6C8F
MDIRQSEVNHNFILNLSCPVESGAQAFTRLVKPPSLIPLHQKLLPQAPKPSEVIEISYDKDTPHNALISDFISNAILPIELGGKNAEVTILILCVSIHIGATLTPRAPNFQYFERPKYRYPYYDENGRGKLLYGYGGSELYQYKTYSPLEGIH